MADLEKELLELDKSVDDFRGRANVDVREITINDDVRALQQKWNIEDIPALDPKFSRQPPREETKGLRQRN